MASHFIPSDVLTFSHSDLPGIIVPPQTSGSVCTMTTQNPVPSSSPCQECAIHNTIIQSMAFSMQNPDCGNCHRSHTKPPCSNCSHASEQQPLLLDRTFYSHPIYRTHCGHNLAENYVQYGSHITPTTQCISYDENTGIDLYHEWNNNNICRDEKVFPIPVTLSVTQSSHTHPLSYSIPALSTEQGSPHQENLGTERHASYKLRSRIVTESVSGENEFLPSLSTHLSTSTNDSPTSSSTTHASTVDQLHGLSRMKIYEVDINPDISLDYSDGDEKKSTKSSQRDKKSKSRIEKKTFEVRKRQPEDLCAVCGDKASGYHYNALTCEGCKGFFRRSITNKTIYKQGCKQGGSCEMDTYTRRKCPHCRFKKCKQVGMLEECLLTEIQCRSKRIRRQQRKQQKEEVNRKSEEMVQSTSITSPEHLSIASSPSESDGSQHSEYSGSLGVTTEEAKLIDVVAVAFKKYKINPEIVRKWEEYINKESRTTCRLSDITTVHVQVLVEYAKNIPGFLSLEYADQIALLKGSIFEAMLIRNSCGYHHLRRDINKSAILEELGIESTKFEALLDFFKAIGKLDMDEIEYGLLIAIVIFNSDYDFVKNKDLVDEYQDLYLSALAKYSMTRVPVRTAIFARILAMLTEIRSVSHFNAEIVSSWKKRGALTPLLCEIWDLE